MGYDERLPNRPSNQLGSYVCGEQGLIAAMEFRAGLKKIEVSQAARSVAYLKALKAADNGERFYSNSFQVDEMASAATLLAWRDWSILHGWKHDERSNNFGRFHDFDAVEQHFTKIGSSLGERIYALIPRLAMIKSSITGIELHHTKESWPPLYQLLFKELRNAGVSVTEVLVNHQPQAIPDSDLGKLQRALLAVSKEPVSLRHDGSLRLIATANKPLAAQYAVQAANDKAIVISKKLNHYLETALELQAGNHSGVGDTSGSRSPNQLLFLMLQSAWKTPSANALLQFLTLPAGRFKSLRKKIARSFRDLPGVNRDLWQSQIDEFVTRVLVEKPEQDEAALRHAISDWLPISLTDNDEYMPLSLAICLAERVAGYWRSLLMMTEQEQADVIYSSAFAAADAVAEALREWPDNSISKMQLNRLLTMTLSIGNSRYCNTRQVSAFDIVANPEVVQLKVDNPEQVIWLDPEVSPFHAAPPLSRQELRGIPLAPTLTQQAQFMQQALARAITPLLAASKSLTLISTDMAPELLKLQLMALLGKDVWLTLEDTVLNGQQIYVTTEQVPEFSLPRSKRWQHIDQPIPSPRETESYSSLAALALKPHEYVLKYSAKLYEDSTESLTVNPRLLGNLAHHLVEYWLNTHPWTGQPVESTEINDWLNTNLPIFIQKIALPLAQPGKQVERMRFQQQMLAAIDALFNAMASANVVNVQPERTFKYDDALCQLTSNVDLYCELHDGRFAIIDMKWGSYEKYREELQAGRPLQLATYVYITERSSDSSGHSRYGQFADAGYFILSRAELLCNSNLTFPTATVVDPALPTSFKLTWQQFEKTLRWRLAQLEKGDIELTYGNADVDDKSVPPGDALDLIVLEQSATKRSATPYKAQYKAIDVWRNLTGNIKDI
ncbi:PD-(D/E)XK nuclease family protein [Rheinheimera sp. UJ51]|uniref:PD-(D/E)XK nuclease family protein n=1 Tax=Rheinheimera sp. UJ51 TaxID=2892446 RepID=UPI001E5193F9|nr:PD-(D/E)XK nuclease family protein [Rheinheimera sp. UJ51]MCC5452886.1 PD-(D/E)XK nuclease family protein [Rheinheimera sp. UJ51]